MATPGKIAQWPVHYQKLYHRVSAKNQKRKAKFSEAQREHLKSLWATEAQKYAEYAGPTTDYPDGLAEVFAEQYIIGIVEKSEKKTE